MRQISVLPSGCQITSKSILHVNSSNLYFTSTLALYVVDTKTYSIEKVIALGEKLIFSIAVSPHDPNRVCSISADGSLLCWNICEERVSHRNTLAMSAPSILAWDPINPEVCAVVVGRNQSAYSVYFWDMSRGNEPLSSFHDSGSMSTESCVAMAFNPFVDGQLALGCSNGYVYLLESKKKAQPAHLPDRRPKILNTANRTVAVVDLKWDLLSSIYLLVAYENFVSLWDTQAGSEMHAFEKQGIGISSIAWMAWTSGNFLTTNARTGVVKVWNVSQKQPLQSVRITEAGINTVAFSGRETAGLFACVDGSLAVYDMERSCIAFKTCAGHTDTIFDCLFSVDNPDLFASSSYEGTVKIWRTSTFELVKTLYTSDSIVYKVAWSPRGNIIAGATFKGTVVLWDVHTGRECATIGKHQKPVYGLSWNGLVDDLILYGSGDNRAVIVQVDYDALLDPQGETVLTGSRKVKANPDAIKTTAFDTKVYFSHPGPVFGCSWCPYSPNLFVTCCYDGRVRIFDYAQKEKGARATLNGHKQRVFNCEWSKLSQGLLASTSDDREVKLWRVDIEQILSSSEATKVDPIKTLVGHTSNVRAICWSDEDVNLLLTGSWDSTIRVWDCWTGECQVINHHAADVYAITSHPNRPFVFVSSSRDTTIRMWEIDGKYKAMRYLAAAKLSFKDLFFQDSAVSSDLAVLRGSGSRAAESLIEFLTANEAPENKLIVQLLKYYVVYNFFCGCDGSLDIIESLIDAEVQRLEVNVSHLVEEVLRPSNLRQVVHNSTIVSRARSEATRLESAKAGGRRGEMKGKVAEQLADAAKIYAQIGDYESYCNVMVELGEWTTAIAIAPKVSLEFWSSLVSQYADFLKQSLSEKSVPFFLASDRVDDAISVYFDRKDFQSALVVSKVHEDISGGSEVKKSPSRVKQPSRNTSADWLSATMDQTSAAEVIPHHKPSRLRSKATSLLVDSYLSRSQSMLAAASFAAIGDVSSLVEVLNMNGDYDLAFVVSTLYNLSEESSRASVAQVLADSGAIGVAIEMFEANPNADLNIGQLLCRGTFDETEAAIWISKSKVKTHQWWIQNAREEESIGRDDKAVLSYALSWQFEKAALMGLNVLKSCVRDASLLSPAARATYEALKNVRAWTLEPSLRYNFLSHMLWFGAHQAAELGYFEIACAQLNFLAQKVRSHGTAIALTETEIKYQHAFFTVASGDKNAAVALFQKCTSEMQHALKSLSALLCLDGPGDLFGKNTAEVSKEIQRLGDSMSLPSLAAIMKDRKVIKAVELGSKLPTASLSAVNRKNSLITLRPIQGFPLALEDGLSYISMNEALMWTHVNPFSPTFSGMFLKVAYKI